MLWLALTFPDLGLAVHTRSESTASPDTPLALVREGRVLACNMEAADAGVLAGQRTSSAVALCPRLRFLEHLPEEEERLMRQLAEACIAITPTVVLGHQHTVLLEVEGCLSLFKGHSGLLKQLRRALRGFKIPYQLAQGHTPKAAQALAQAGLGETSLALSLPLQRENVEPLLAQVPVTVLPWPDKLQQKLAALHLITLGDLFALPRPALSKRLGVATTRHLGQLLGEHLDPQQPITLAEDFQSTLHFLDGISHVEGMRFPMKRLLEEFCQFLRQRQLSCSRFQWRFTHQDKSRQSLTIASARGEPQAARFMQLTELKLEHAQLSAPVEVITLIATEFQPQSDTRLSLLPEPGEEDSKALELLDRLRARLGNDACQCFLPESTHRPEQAQQSQTKPAIATTAIYTESQGLLRPFWLWPEPKAMRVMDNQLWWQGAFTVLSLPERIAMPWWEDGETRDYFLARHDNGGHYWIYFSWQSQSWFCHGLFG